MSKPMLEVIFSFLFGFGKLLKAEDGFQLVECNNPETEILKEEKLTRKYPTRNLQWVEWSGTCI